MAKYHVPISLVLEIDIDCDYIEKDIIQDARYFYIQELKKFIVKQNFDENIDNHKSSTIKAIDMEEVLIKIGGYPID